MWKKHLGLGGGPISLLCNLALVERRPEILGQLQALDLIEKRTFLRRAPTMGGLYEEFSIALLPQ